MADRHVGDFGQTIRINTPDVNYAGYTAAVICVILPSGAHVEWTPTVINTTERYVEYILEEGDLSRAGNYEISVRVTYAGAGEVVTDSFMLVVAETPC